MFPYSFCNQLDQQNVVWVFLQPAQLPTFPDFSNLTNSCYLVGSLFSEKKDINEQKIKNVNKCLEMEKIDQQRLRSGNIGKIKIKKNDQQFDPTIPETRANRKIRQNQNRNVLPNIMHQVMSFLQKRNKSQIFVKRLIQKLGLQAICTTKRFYFYQSLLKQKLYHYVNVQSLSILKQLQQPLCQIYDQQEQRHYNKISRLLIHYFLTQEFTTSILTSRRVNSDKKQEHLESKRKILEKLYQLFRQ